MPVTFPAHQGIVIGAKMAAPKWIDGTSLCIGAAAPDLAYGLHDWLGLQSHTPTGLIVWAVPFTLISVWILRWRAADGVFGMLPDLGGLELNSYRVLGTRSHAIPITVGSALAGSATHIVIDAFTHPYRWGADWVGLNDLLFVDPLNRDFTVADALQYFGHIGGSMAFVVSIALIGRSGSLQRWYGADVVASARAKSFSNKTRLVFWGLVGLSTALAIPIAVLTGNNMLFLCLAAGYGAALAAGAFIGSSETPTFEAAMQ